MKFPHAFVVARLLPAVSAQWTSKYGPIAAERIRTRPFAALRVHWSEETGLLTGSPHPYISRGYFIVSREKPRAPFQHLYLPLAPSDNEKEPLTLNHPLVDNGLLYLHMFPAMTEHAEDETRKYPIQPSYHQLDDASFRRFVSFFKDFRPPRIPPPTSGGDEEVQSTWSSFSGQANYELVRQPKDVLSFEISPFSSEVLDQSTGIWEELVLLKILTKDYSWRGITSTIHWLEALRQATITPERFLPGTYAYAENIPQLSDENSRRLFGMEVPVDGQPLSEDVDEQVSYDNWDDSWGMGPAPEFRRVEPAATVIPEKETHLVVLDICSVLFDRPAAVRAAVQKLGIANTDDPKWTKRLRELEALEYRAHGGTYEQIARRALRALLISAAVPQNDEANSCVEAAVKALLNPPVDIGAQTCLAALRASGLHVIGFSTFDASTFNNHLRDYVDTLPLEVLPLPDDASGLFEDCATHVQNVAEYAKARYPQISSEQILVVSSSSVRILEPATAQRMPTALLERFDDPEVSSLPKIYTVKSTMVVSSLENLPAMIRQPTLWKRSEAGKREWPGESVCGMYQLYAPIGSSSDATVSRATNWLTDESVAVKYSMPQISAGILQYEARIYEQLSGSRAIPSLHWSGSDGGADVLVMDLLGPTLDHMQCACRGSFTFKSVLMIGLQILDFVEFAHSRGIILRDIKPHNFAVGHALTPDSAGTIYAFDFGLAKMYVDPLRKTHIPLRTGREICGTIRYSSHWSHLGLEASRRDDIVGLGHTLLNLLHGRLPWQGFYAASVEAKLARIGEMKAPSNAVLMEFLSRSPTALRDFMAHGHSLDFEQKPDYELLRGLLEAALRENGWVNDGMFDWMEPSLAPRGTVLLSEYKCILEPDVVPATMRPLSDRINKFPPEFRDQIR